MQNSLTFGPPYRFQVVGRDELSYAGSSALAQMYKLSPCVWRDSSRYELLLRVVNRSDTPSRKIARIHYGSSLDGLRFVLDEQPVIAPGPDTEGSYDSGGCEDPTLACVDGVYYVYYTGWNEHLKRGELLLATGTDIHRLEKRGVALPSTAQIINPKEATVVRASDGSWRLFFEYAQATMSKVGIARSSHVAGPWEVLTPLFDVRPDSWDSWHLSTGPILESLGELPVMFYNGASKSAMWRIGYIVFNPNYTSVVARSPEPLIMADEKRNPDDSDIAFSSSVVTSGAVYLYYSVADQYCKRATMSRR